jgi:antitoxin YefM
MRATTVSALRTNLARTLDAVVDDKEEVVIARERGSAVIVDLREYESLKETAYLLRSPANARRLFRSIEQLDRGEGEAHRLV